MANKKAAKKAEFYVIGIWDDAVGPFNSVKECEDFFNEIDEGGNYTIAQVVAKYEVKIPIRKNAVTKKEV